MLLALLLFFAFLILYARTSAPSVLSGDSAEFQMAAPLLGVSHPTTYPLYTLLGKLFTLVVPFRDLAWRVTLVSSFCAALAVALLFLVARRVTDSLGAALIAALAFGFSPGLWNTATLAEVYALLMALLALLAWLLMRSQEPGSRYQVLGVSTWLCAAAFVAGLGFSHHGLFAFTGLPLLAGYIIQTLVLHRSSSPYLRASLLRLSGCFALGLTPWLFLLIQYARYGPFNGIDYGLPQHYFWGAPQSWAEAISLLFGGPIRQGIFRIPSLDHTRAVLELFVTRLGFEFGPLGCVLGVVGCIVLWRRNRTLWLGAMWIIVGTLLYVVLLGRAVQDADVFTLPVTLPWALWVSVGADGIARRLARRPTTDDRRPTSIAPRVSALGSWFLVLTVGLTLVWGYTRLPYTDKRSLWLFREWGQATLQTLPPHAVVMTHWEQGMALQYLVLAEHQRPDVFIDIVEPGDEAWDLRARRRYADRPVFLVGNQADVAAIPVELVDNAEYASVFRLH